MQNAIEIGNQWSAQEVVLWYQASDGPWMRIRTVGPLWNFLGTLRTTIRMQRGYYLFPVGFDAREEAEKVSR